MAQQFDIGVIVVKYARTADMAVRIVIGDDGSVEPAADHIFLGVQRQRAVLVPIDPEILSEDPAAAVRL